MCKMYGIIEALCSERGIKPGKMCADLGISRGIMGDLKAGRTKRLSAENIEKVASYFGVSADYLMGKDESTSGLNQRDKRDIAKTMAQLMEQLADGEDLMFDGDPISDEARASMLSAMQLGLEAAKIRNKERFTPKKNKKG